MVQGDSWSPSVGGRAMLHGSYRSGQFRVPLVQGGESVMWGRDLTSHMTEDRILCLHHGEGTVGRQWGQ